MELFEVNVNSDKPFTRYMGGKQYARKQILSLMPPDLKVLVSPFIGSGSVELKAASKGVRVYGYDNYNSLVRHWNLMLARAGEVMRTANQIFPMKADILRDLVKSERIHCMEPFPKGFPKEKEVLWAAIVTCMQLQGYNGLYMNSIYFRDRDDPWVKKRSIYTDKHGEDFWNNWKNDNISVEVSDWKDTLKKHANDYLFCDPPYVGCEHYYGQYTTRKTKYQREGFNHEEFADALARHKNGWLLTYQKDKTGFIKSLYKDFDIIETKWLQGSVVQRNHLPGAKNPDAVVGAKEFIIRKPYVENSERADISEISRVYGGYYWYKKDASKRFYYQSHYIPKNLCEYIERAFGAFLPSVPPRLKLEKIIRDVPYRKLSCSPKDVHDVVSDLLKRGIIIQDGEYLGYPKLEISDMNEHIREMSKKGIPVKARPHFSYSYQEGAVEVG